ncbi:hypothetical protein [Streptomyces sp. cg36]|uniref:hypothetical protein n=1 Tax=Streptomyces sp. cg36 TaxID=3238798 RepID=UPI0034E2D98B
MRAAAALYAAAHLPWRARTGAALTALLDGWRLLGHREPVPASRWHPAHPDRSSPPRYSGAYALLATPPHSPLRLPAL